MIKSQTKKMVSAFVDLVPLAGMDTNTHYVGSLTSLSCRQER